LGTTSAFVVRVGGISVHGLENREIFDMHCHWSELGETVNLELGMGIFCIGMEGFPSVMVRSCASRTSHFDMGVM
jgi:hypothetical protein